MREGITNEELKFMLDEFGLTREQIRKMSDEEYDKLYRKILFIFAEEIEKVNDQYITERCRIAESVLDKMYYDQKVS